MSFDPAAIGLKSHAAGSGTQVQSKGAMSLGQADFLTLLVTQLKNQDPLSPLENDAFVAQLAQFSTVSGITEMNQSLKTMAAGTTDLRSSAPQWIGRTVTLTDSESGAGVSARVSSVTFTTDGKLLLNLENGKITDLANITAVS